VPCPDCGTPWSGIPLLSVDWLQGALVHRCSCCGVRWIRGAPPRRIATCSRCEAPFPEDPLAVSARCLACQGGERSIEAREATAVLAAEGDLRLALARRWTFLGSAETSEYLDRLAREVGAALEGAPAAPQVALVSQDIQRSLVLPSGIVLLSAGAIDALDDEAELAFVLAHELAHAAARDVGGALVRFGLAALGRHPHGAEDEAWLSAALDLSRLGCGERREHAADAAALRALLRLGYDPASVARWLSRLEAAADRGDPACAEVVLAHPPAADRLRRLARISAAAPAHPRVRRELFWRVLGRDGWREALQPVAAFDEPERRERRVSERSFRQRHWAWTLVAIALLATLLLLFGLL
jgi:hypothetical protein